MFAQKPVALKAEPVAKHVNGQGNTVTEKDQRAGGAVRKLRTEGLPIFLKIGRMRSAGQAIRNSSGALSCSAILSWSDR